MKKTIDLQGVWEIFYNQSAKGSITELELPTTNQFNRSIEIPGCLQGQGIGDDISQNTNWVQSLYDKQWYLRDEYKFAQDEKVRVPFLSQPPKTFRGKAWYRKLITIQDTLDYTLKIECTKWKTGAWIDGKFIGEFRSLCAPHVFFLGKLEAGEHELIIGIDNGWQLPYRPDGHGVSDALGATWNGMSGDVILTGKSQISISDIKAYSDCEENAARYEVTFSNTDRLEHKAVVRCKATCSLQEIQEDITWSIILPPGESRHSLEHKFTNKIDAWDEFSANLVQADFVLEEEMNSLDNTNKICADEEHIVYGFIKAETKDGFFLINDRKTYLRGTHIGGEFPLTGYTDCSLEYWSKIMKTVREWGLNFIRFHSFCPPEAAFYAADQEGVYLQVECAMWNIFSKENPMNQILREETMNILDAFGNHPSFLCLSPSNEPGGDWDTPLKEWVVFCREYDSRKLYTMQSGWPFAYTPDKIDGQDYVYFHRSGFGIEPGGTIRGPKGWNGSDYRVSLAGIKYPVICHELGQWCSYPDFDIIDKFKGFMQPGNYEVFKASAKAHGVYERNKEFAYCSGKLQMAMYKEDLEANFRTPHIYGFELLDLHDYLGQGTALIGVLDAFWDEKPGTDKTLWKKFCGETVPLARLEKKVFECGEQVRVPVEVCHFGKNEINAKITWKLIDENETGILSGELGTQRLPVGKNIEVGKIAMTMPVGKAKACKLVITIADDSNVFGENEWNLWYYPVSDTGWDGSTVDISSGNSATKEKVIATRNWHTALLELEKGSRVLFAPAAASLSYRCPPLRFTPVFWNAQMGPTWDRGMGLSIQHTHPALKDFPSKEYADWQWEEIMKDASGFLLEDFSGNTESVVTVIDEWNRNKRMALLFEANVLKGKLLLSMAEPKKQISSVQFYNSLFTYIAADEFCPKQTINADEIKKLFFDRDVMDRRNVKVAVTDSATGDISKLRYPYSVEFTMEEEDTIKGLCYMPRQNHREHAGDIREYEVYYKEGNIWVLLHKDTFATSFEPKTVMFTQSVKTKHLRFCALSGFEEKEGFCWEAHSDGWYQKYKKYLDESIQEPKVTLLFGDDTEAEGINLDWKQSKVQNFKAEKSATKEIDA